MLSTFLQHIILIENMGKGNFKENEEKNCYTTIKTQDTRSIKGYRVSKLFLIIDERCKGNMFYLIFQEIYCVFFEINISLLLASARHKYSPTG